MSRARGYAGGRRSWTIQVTAPGRTPLNPQSSEDLGRRLILGEHNQRSHANHLPQHPGNRSTAFQNMSNRRPRLDDLASRSAQRQEAPVCRNPETPPNCPGSAQERPQAMTEIDIASDHEQAERGGTPLISSWNLNREPCRFCTTIKRQRELPEMLTGKRCRSPQYRSTATCLENGRWRGLLSPASKSTALSARSSGGE